jgi:hypothetical protein
MPCIVACMKWLDIVTLCAFSFLRDTNNASPEAQRCMDV